MIRVGKDQQTSSPRPYMEQQQHHMQRHVLKNVSNPTNSHNGALAYNPIMVAIAEQITRTDYHNYQTCTALTVTQMLCFCRSDRISNA